jgi:DUF1365 family protein
VVSAGWVYVGSIAHHRAAVRPHGFRSPAFLIGIDLAELPAVNRRFRWLGHNRIRPLAIWDRDYLGGGSAPLRTRLARWLPGLDDAGNTERVVLVTTPRVLHYAFNPISVFYCIGRDGGLTRALAEVHSTYGEAHVYPLPGAAATVAKELFVSPFFGVDGDYAFELRAPDERLALTIRLCHAGRTSLAATLEARGRPLSDAALLAGLVRRPLTAALAYPRIVWQGLVLRYRRGLTPRMRPPALGERTVVRVPGRPARRRAR